MTRGKSSDKYQLIMRDAEGNEQLIAEGKFTSITLTDRSGKSYIKRWAKYIKTLKDGYKNRR